MRDLVPIENAVTDYQLADGGSFGTFRYPTADDWQTWKLDALNFRKLRDSAAHFVVVSGRTGTSKTVHLIAAGFYYAAAARKLSGSSSFRDVWYAKAVKLDVRRRLDSWSGQHPSRTLFLLDDVQDNAKAAASLATAFVENEVFRNENRLILCGRFVPRELEPVIKMAKIPDPGAVAELVFEINPILVQATALSAGVTLNSGEAEKLAIKPWGARLIFRVAKKSPRDLRIGNLAESWASLLALSGATAQLLDRLSLLRLSGFDYRPSLADATTAHLNELRTRSLARVVVIEDQENWSTWDDEVASSWLLYRVGSRDANQFENFLRLSTEIWYWAACTPSPLGPFLLTGWKKIDNASAILAALQLESPDVASPILGPLCCRPDFAEQFSNWCGSQTANLALKLESIAAIPTTTPWLQQLIERVLKTDTDQIERAIASSDFSVFFGLAAIRLPAFSAERAGILHRFIDVPDFLSRLTGTDYNLRDRCISVIIDVLPARLPLVLDKVYGARLRELRRCEPSGIWTRLNRFVENERRHGLRLAEALPKDLLKRAAIADPRPASRFARDIIFERKYLLVRADARQLYEHLAGALETVDYKENEFKRWKHPYYLVNWVNLSARMTPARSLDSPRFRSHLVKAVVAANGAVLHYLAGFAAKFSRVFPGEFLTQTLEQSLKDRRLPLGERIHCLWKLDPQRAVKIVPEILQDYPEPVDLKQAFWIVWNSFLATPDNKKSVVDYAEWMRESLQDLAQTSTAGAEAMLQWLALRGLLAWILKERTANIVLASSEYETVQIDSVVATAFEIFGLAIANRVSRAHIDLLRFIAAALSSPSERFTKRIARTNPQQRSVVRQIYHDGLERLLSRPEYAEVSRELASAITARIEPLLKPRQPRTVFSSRRVVRRNVGS
jgi:hypothetical protein